MKVYLDNSATTKIDPAVLRAMLPYLKVDYGNASSIYSLGQKARGAVENSRQKIAKFLGCSAVEVFFTGSATESDNMAIFGVVQSAIKAGINKPHIITSQIEHPAVIEPCKYLAKQGVAEVDFLPAYKDGIIKIEDVKKTFKPNTCLVSIMYANNEVGTIQPIAEIADIVSNFRGAKQFPVFHCDAVQAVNYLPCDVKKLGVDLLTISGHKIYGPKGIGALFVRKGVRIEPLLFGGHQEAGLRPGTENVAGIVGMGEAIKKIKNEKPVLPDGRQARLKIKNLERLRNKLIEGILTKVAKSFLNGSLEYRLPNNANFSFDGVEGEAIVMALDQKGIACSTGSACSSGSLEPSYVLRALGLSDRQAHGSVRFSLGKYNTAKEIDYVLRILPNTISHLRRISGFCM